MLDRIRRVWREGGPRGLALAVAQRIPGVRYAVVYSLYRLRFEEFRPRDVDPSLSFGWARDEAALDDLLAVQDKRARFEARLAAGHRALVAYQDDRPVGYVWLQLTSVHVEERFGFEIPLEPGDVYDFDSFVRPECRGRGVLGAMHGVLVEEFARVPGRTHLAAVIEVNNPRSIRAYQFMGFRRGRTYVAWRFLSWSVWRPVG